MLPIDLEPDYMRLPETDDHGIVIITGTSLRHKRFAYRLQKAFGELVLAWYELDHHVALPGQDTVGRAGYRSPRRAERLVTMLRRGLPSLLRRDVFGTLALAYGLGRRVISDHLLLRAYRTSAMKAEQRVLRRDLVDLLPYSRLEPIKINPATVHDAAFLEQIRSLDPYFLLTLGGPLYKKPLLEIVRGVAINQHAGHSPTLKGAHTTEWALYHRSLNHVSSTVHITTTGADAGPILRRSNPCVLPEDDIHTIFLRVVSLGTELMVESVQEIMSNKTVVVFRQPRMEGRTFLAKEYGLPVIKALVRDFRSGWLRTELRNQREY